MEDAKFSALTTTSGTGVGPPIAAALGVTSDIPTPFASILGFCRPGTYA